MIFYLVTAQHRYTILTYLASFGRPVAKRIHPLFYEDMPRQKQFARGTYIFSDLERLSSRQRAMATELWEQLAQAGQMKLLNHPNRVLRRYDLLHGLYETGRNRFRAARACHSSAVQRFPVFVRQEHEHTKPLTPLLGGRAELEGALVRLEGDGHSLRDLLIVEFCDTSDASGLHRKFSAFRIGETILPGHLYISPRWVVKRSDAVLDETWSREEGDYLESNPHASWLRDVFDFARIDYGRIDYSVLSGEPQVWEINTNPMLFHLPEQYPPTHLGAQKQLAARMQPLFESIDSCASDTATSVAISISADVLRELRIEAKGWRRARRAQAWRARWARCASCLRSMTGW